MSKYLLLLILLVIPSCSAVGMAKDLFVKDKGLSVDTEIVLGDKQEEMDVQVGAKQQAEEIINNTNVSIPMMLLLALGWLLPSPSDIWRGFLKLLPWVNTNG